MPTTLDDLMSRGPIEHSLPQLTEESLRLISEIRESLTGKFPTVLDRTLMTIVNTTPLTKLAGILREFSDDAESYVARIPDLIYPFEDSITTDHTERKKISYRGLFYDNISYELVAKVADDIYESAKFVTWIQVAKMIGRNDGLTISRYLREWEKKRGMQHKKVNMEIPLRRDDLVAAYFKGTRPPITATERIEAALKEIDTGKDEIVDIKVIRSKASVLGLDLTKNKVASILGHLHYIHYEGEEDKYKYKNPN